MKGYASAARREIEREARAVTALDPWAVAAEVLRGELRRREAEASAPPAALADLSPGAALLLGWLHEHHDGAAFYVDIAGERVGLDREAVLSAAAELDVHGFVAIERSRDEAGVPAEVIVRLLYDAEMKSRDS